MCASSSRSPPPPPPPEEPLTYPITFAKLAEEDSTPADAAHTATPAASAHLRQVGIFSALHWLVPVYELAEWAPKAAAASQRSRGKGGGNDGAEAANDNNGSEEAAALVQIPYEDVRSALTLLPQFQKFYVESSKIIPQHTDLYYYVESLTLPTPRGPKVISRSKVEGDYRAAHVASHAPATAGAAGATTATTVTNSTACFSLLAGHNHFLLYYEEREKLRYFNYLQLDQLRFAWVAVKELIEDNKVFNLNDGSLTGFAKRDLKKNNMASPFCSAPAAQAAASNEAHEGNGNNNNKAPTNSSNNSGGSAGPVVGRGGGNARLHQGTSGNVITAPKKDVLEEKKRMQSLRFLREELEKECERRWPYTPVAKSCLFTVEEVTETELPAEALAQLGLVGAHNARNSKNTNRRGPRYYLGVVELPMLNKKGGAARFKAARWHNNRRDAESAAAEVTLMSLRNMKA
ncbi:hypothetical protein ABB37_08827 [Leptomonas pyrrhocoris]|uniref:Uncharacterized protein n=1 Tax=Leptomonas pyrrhocoris TaxID=157538 RepID=A0A0M9FSI4_LEPPY|nr:hypothetical protein ABB37_08827 [Leptomonas pyrrhocoris]KPA75165.1 hypothetical protein ABB37_08827 [Leptomonas pyrrhocoris]|eukprot:XP_015653604.1 hypothetical protein ABB37_08827 [Leptomonas pyrrhocoris]